MNQEINYQKILANLTSEQPFDRKEHQKQAVLWEMNSFNETPGNKTHCKRCKGKGYIMGVIRKFDSYYTIVKECDCMANIKACREVKNSGMAQLLNYSFNNYKVESNWQADIKKRAMANANTKDWFFIGGQSGSGKTHICCAIANYQRRKGVRVKYIVWTDTINKLKDFEDDSYMSELKKVECLYIDDLFKKIGTKYSDGLTSSDITKTWELINYRNLNNLKTIISSEMTLIDILNVDESLGSRIKQSAKNYSVTVPGDVRKNMRINQMSFMDN